MVLDHSLDHLPVVPASYAQLHLGLCPASLYHIIPVRTPSQISPAADHPRETAHEWTELKDLGQQVLTGLAGLGCDPRLGWGSNPMGALFPLPWENASPGITSSRKAFAVQRVGAERKGEPARC